MAKAILIMDMPEHCYHCQLVDSEYDICLGMVTDDMPASEVKKYECPNCYRYPKRPDWCPLTPEPERMTEWVKRQEEAEGRDYVIGMTDGWNACLDALEGKTDE